MILTADIGTSSVKTGLVRPDGSLAAWHRSRLPSLPANPPEWRAEYWISAFAEGIQSCFRQSGTFSGELSGIIVSGNGPTIVPVGFNGLPSGPVLLWNDTCTLPFIPGTRSFYLPKIAWLYRNCPDIAAATRYFFTCPDYLAWLLTGEAVTSIPHDGFAEAHWSAADLVSWQVPGISLPPFVPSGSRLGVTKSLGSLLPLVPGIPVFAGGADFLSALIGSGAVLPGRVCDRAGTSEGINVCHADPIRSPGVRTLPHAVEGLYNLAAVLPSTGRIFEWYRERSGFSITQYEQLLDRIAAALPAHIDSDFIFPARTERGSDDYRLSELGPRFAAHGSDDFGVMLIESIGFSIRSGIDALHRAGAVFDTLRVTGGQSKNTVWNQLKADMTGLAVAVPRVNDAELLGNALLAQVGLGRFSSLVEAAESQVVLEKTYEPDVHRTAGFSERYARYQSLRNGISQGE